ncbi:aldo/keto reductase [Frigoribacterium sp. PhB118]|uniref:aldo/keto reductase n=1 Tax=Frigoribacterium sp. PhB118 TaxID=2485175 RepID=UPI000F46BDFF|nr:aldo/keto reductase [Frigoribacterium sp. PhB118]ROS57656.1 aryl-alcohol dehydrogenase-like predicted oxidoreductase [Frigoribacterium sp. PhB118]
MTRTDTARTATTPVDPTALDAADTVAEAATRPAPPRLVLGTMTFGDTVDEATAARMLDTARDAGVTWIDTANAYVGGTTETMLGRLLAGRRDEVVLASKAGMPHADAGGLPPLSAVALRASVEASLRRLGTDRLDLFYLHQPDRATPLDETLSTVAALVAEGKVLSLGVSNYAAWQIGDVERVADAVGAPRPVVAQQLCNLVARRLDDEYLEFASVHGLETMVYNPLGGGLLTGRHRFDETPADGRFGDSALAEMYTKRYWDADLFAAIDRLSGVAAEAGVTLVELALRWVAYRPEVGSVLLGGSRPEQLTANVAAVAAGPLPDEVVAACDEVGRQLRGPMPPYAR